LQVVSFVSGPALTNIPSTGTATYQVQSINNTFSATLPISNDGLAREIASVAGPLTATVNFNPSPSTPAMTLTPFKLTVTNNPSAELNVAGANSIPSSSIYAPIEFNRNGQSGAFVARNAATFAAGVQATSPPTVAAQLLGNGAVGMGVTYSVPVPNAGAASVSGAIFLRKDPPPPQ
jgi:hypothetical protein